MPVPPTALGLLQQAIPNLSAAVAAMPIKDGYVPAAANVKAFGQSGNHGARRFQFSLDISAVTPGGIDGAVPVTAMFEGQVSWIGKNVAIEPPREDGSVFLTRRSGLLLKVHPRSAVGRLTLETIDDPLEYPFPLWVLYEGVEPDPAIDSELERLASTDFFAFDSAVLPAAAHPQLDDLIVSLEANPNLRAHLTGYTDAEGNTAHNLQLGFQRAEAIRTYLRGAGIDNDRIKTETKGEEFLKLRDAPDRDAAGINRRVEIEIRPEDVGYVQAGADIGTATESVSVTVFDALGYFIDPLYIALQLRPDLAGHPLAPLLDPLSPVVASNVVHVVSDDPSTDAAVDGNPDIIFHDAADIAVLNAGRNDTVWVDLQQTQTNIVVPRSVSLIGKPRADGTPPQLSPRTDTEPIVHMQRLDVEPQEYGLRILGLTFVDGRCPDGAAVRVANMHNVLIGRCSFRFNFAGPGFNSPTGNGGAIRLSECDNVLIRSCRFTSNGGISGGALYAEECRNLVITGTPAAGLDAVLSSEADLEAGPLPAVMTEQAFSSVFTGQMAQKAGGAVAIKNCAYAIRHTFFANNEVIEPATATYGGAVAAQIETGEWEARVSSITRCVAIGNHASFGGGFGIIGAFDDSLAINGNPNSHAGGGQLRIVENVVHRNVGDQMGGGLHVVSGRHHLIGNRLSNNTGTRNGGGVSFIGNTRTALVDNRILLNRVPGDNRNDPFTSFPVPPNGVGGGGAGVYATFWIHPLSPELSLRGNRILRNTSFETGGALRATCGARVTLESGNVLQDNIAFLHGGAVALNSATLVVGPENQFIGNSTQDGRTPTATVRFRGGHGGAIYCYGGKVAGTDGDDFRFATCGSDGTALLIDGTDADPVVFSDNRSALKGGALYIEREDATTNHVPRRVRVEVRRAQFAGNLASAPVNTALESYLGAAIAVFRLDLPGPTLNPALVLEHSRVEIAEGIGLHLVASSASFVKTSVTYVQMPGPGPFADELVE